MNIQLDYEYKASTSEFVTLQDSEHFISNLSILLEWSPFSTETELLQQARPTFFKNFMHSTHTVYSLHIYWLLGQILEFYECDISLV